jgi:serine phosphatase RsbU (regulator of sigma subunit)/HAMP domain-containing protein
VSVSLGARLLSVTLILQVMALLIGVIGSSWQRAGEMMEQEEKYLAHHVDRYVENWNRNAPSWSGPEGIRFQHLTSDLRILADTADPKRVGKRLARPHPFLERALKTGSDKGSVRFPIPSERIESYGRFHFLPDRSLALASIPGHHFLDEFMKSLVELGRLGLFLGGCSLLLTLLLFRSLLRPLRDLTLAMEEAENGRLDVTLPQPANDETGTLIRVSGVLIERIRMLLAGEARSSRMEEEVNIAAEIQSRLLPPPEVRLGVCEIQSHYQSATETGGDFWGCFESGGRVYLYVGDVTGHGLPSALVTAGVRGALATLIKKDGEAPSSPPTLKEILDTANLAVWDIGGGELQMTLFVSVLDHSDGSLHYAGAGHPPAWLFRKSDGGKSSILHSRGTRLGEGPALSVIDENKVIFGQGDTLLLYTDGLLTPMGEDLTAENRTALRAKISEILAREEHLERSKTAIEFLLFEATQGSPPADDITFALMRLAS